jgi:hypothetical protein
MLGVAFVLQLPLPPLSLPLALSLPFLSLPHLSLLSFSRPPPVWLVLVLVLLRWCLDEAQGLHEDNWILSPAKEKLNGLPVSGRCCLVPPSAPTS